jgi:transposase
LRNARRAFFLGVKIEFATTNVTPEKSAMTIPRFARSFDGFETVDFKEFLAVGRIEIHLRSTEQRFECSRCGEGLTVERGKYRLKLEHLPIAGVRAFVFLWRRKGYCRKCAKSRSEAISFIARETPHLTADYAWWIGRVCEIAPVSRVAELVGQNGLTTWRLDFRRLKQMLGLYKIPEVTEISVDEVYARKKPKFSGESRNRRFFTVISDLKTHRVIWVSESRDKEALDQFFILLGAEACSRIRVVAMDQHDDYAASVRDYCKNAEVVWDRFHIMQNFEEAVNDQRMALHEELGKEDDVKRLTRGRFRFLFLKRASYRTTEESTHIDSVLQANAQFAKLEIIKERMLTFFDEPDEAAAKLTFEQLGDWIWQADFAHLKKWYQNLERGWETLRKYFAYRVTTSVSEGLNNVIKMLKRRAFGYKNMYYFRLKIMQVCGYLNSRYISSHHQLLAQK